MTLTEMFSIKNETGLPIEFTASIPEASGPSITVLPSGETEVWFAQPSKTTITIKIAAEVAK